MKHMYRVAPLVLLLSLSALPITPTVLAQTPSSAASQAKDDHPEPTSYRTLYMTRVTQRNEAEEVLTAMRNMLPRAKLYYVPAQNAMAIRADAEDMGLAERMLADLDRPRKIYRLSYTITEMDGSRKLGVETYSLVIAPGTKTELKQGSRIPILTDLNSSSADHNGELQYLDIGWNIEASLDGSSEGLKLRTKLEQSSLADDKPSSPLQDPVIRQTVLENSAVLTQGKPLLLGSLDVPGSTRREEVQVISEVVP